MTEKDIVRFWAKVNVLGPDDCWEWLDHCTKGGYGQFKLGHKMLTAHRVSWNLTYGPIPEGLCCCHKCDNRKCINPNHMFLGTKKDNTQDMISKGRHSYVSHNGITNGRAALTESQVIEIRRLYTLENHMLQKELALLFGVSKSQIGNIIQRKVWKHI